MSRITGNTRLERVEHILASGSGILDFAIDSDDSYQTWEGREDSDWTVEDINYVENTDEDRLLIHPEGERFTCETDADHGVVRCWCEE
jgi:hypothetical protein